MVPILMQINIVCSKNRNLYKLLLRARSNLDDSRFVTNISRDRSSLEATIDADGGCWQSCYLDCFSNSVNWPGQADRGRTSCDVERDAIASLAACVSEIT